MRITVGNLRRIIKEVLEEAGGASPTPPRPNIRNAMEPSISDREQLGRISVRDKDDPDALAPHLQEPEEDPEDCWGPVPPVAPNPYAMPDFYTKDFNVIPTPPIKR
jgi:hypothetical protein